MTVAKAKRFKSLLVVLWIAGFIGLVALHYQVLLFFIPTTWEWINEPLRKGDVAGPGNLRRVLSFILSLFTSFWVLGSYFQRRRPHPCAPSIDEIAKTKWWARKTVHTWGQIVALLWIATIALLPAAWISKAWLQLDFSNLGGGTLLVWFALVWLTFVLQWIGAQLVFRFKLAVMNRDRRSN